MTDKIRFLGLVALLALAAGCTSKSRTDTPNAIYASTPQKVKALDPAMADDVYTQDHVSFAYESLLQYHFLKRPYVLSPNLAEALPEVSPDGKTYTIKLKQGVLFQDDPCFSATNGRGRELTAEDVVYTFKRIADPETGASVWWAIDGKIRGLNEWREASVKAEQSDYSQPIEGLQALDRYTVRFVLNHPTPLFRYALAMPATAIVAKEAVEYYRKEFGSHPVGTGPFKLAEFHPSSRIVWTKNPTYRQESYPSEGESSDTQAGFLADAGKPLPLADRVIMQVFTEESPAWLSLMSGQLDLLTIPKDFFSQVITSKQEITGEAKTKGLRLIKAPRLDMTRIDFNMTHPLFAKNKLLRQAMSHAVNVGPYIELFFNGRAIPAQGPIPPGLAGYDPAFRNPYRQYDLEKAKALLSQAGYPEGKGLPPLEFLVVATTESRQISEYIEKSFRQIGIRLKISAYSWPEYQASVHNRKAHLWTMAWNADYPDAQNFLQVYYGKYVATTTNTSGYINKEYDRLYEASLKLGDTRERTEMYKQMVRIVTEDAPSIFLNHRIYYGLTQPWLKNAKRHEFAPNRWKYYRIDPSVKR